ncbi:MAG: type III pantothenate kinase [Chloroflexota bacterium]
MLLVIDIGNTNVVYGVYDGEKLIHHWRVSTNRASTADEYGMALRTLFQYAGFRHEDIDAIVIASVVPPLNGAIEQMCSRYFGIAPLVIGPGIKTGLSIRYENPREIGADRIVDAVAGYAKYGGPLIIVDFGTATTFGVIDKDGAYLGGAICPGVGTSTEALFQRAARLPRIDLVKPKNVIGKNTVVGMQAGIIYGYVGLVDGIVRRIWAELGQQCRVIATGGMAGLIGPETETVETIDPFLTLEGMRLVYLRNKE